MYYVLWKTFLRFRENVAEEEVTLVRYIFALYLQFHSLCIRSDFRELLPKKQSFYEKLCNSPNFSKFGLLHNFSKYLQNVLYMLMVPI